jgi:uncharacterized RDD family membrane protein YckC
MFCPQCGAQASSNYRFCTRCGGALTAGPGPAPPSEPGPSGTESAADVYAPFWPRVCAFLIDFLLVVLVCAFLKGLLGIRLESGTQAEQGFFWATVLVLWLYKTIAERSARQASLGKLVFDLKVTDLDGERIGVLRALGRNVAQALSASIMFIGFVMPAFTRRRQALHDLCAGTLVTRRQYGADVIAAASEAETASSPAAAAAATAAAAVPARAPALLPVPASAVPGPVPASAPAATVATSASGRPRTSVTAPAARARREPRPAPSAKRRAPQTNTPPVASHHEHVPARPELPVRLSFSDALIGPDKRAVLENLSDSALEVVLDVKSPVTGAHFSRTFVINPRSFGQVGRAQGWPFAPGQLVTVSNPQYRPLVQTVS